MSGQNDGNKTELPTPKKIKDAEKEGNFVFADTVPHLFALLAGVSMCYVALKSLPRSFDQMLQGAIYLGGASDFNAAVQSFFVLALKEILPPSAMIFATVALFSVLGNVLQTGPVFQFAKFKKGGQAVNPVTNVKNLVSKQTLTRFFLSIIKTALICWICYKMMVDDVGFVDRIYAHRLDILGATEEVFKDMWTIVMIALLCIIPIAAIDYALTRWYYILDNKMSKDEVKREHKEEEGDPEVKAHRKQMGRALIEEPNRLNGASAVIRNPTHIAIVVRYEPNTAPVPYVSEMAEGRKAKNIIRQATELGVPLYEDIPFARALYAKCEVNQHIPLEFSEKLVPFIYWLQNKHPERVFDQPEFAEMNVRIGDVKH